jgi:hypothetical protein
MVSVCLNHCTFSFFVFGEAQKHPNPLIMSICAWRLRYIYPYGHLELLTDSAELVRPS